MRKVRTRSSAALAALLLLFGACSEPQGTDPGDDAAASSDPGEATPGGSEDGGGGESGGGKNGASGSGKPSKGGPGGGGSNGNAGNGAGGQGGGGSQSVAGGGGRGGGGSLGYPAAGRYVYAQEGYEKLCQGPNCDKQQLPPTQTIDATHEASSEGSTTVVTRARTSDRQTLTTTTRYTDDKALITKVVVDFAYGSFNFSQEYEPQPPIESLRFPLQVGESWRGRWEARTAGDYSVRVVGSSPSGNGGGPTYKLETVTNFKGDFTGRAQVTVWIDGRTGVAVKTDGDIAVASGFGEYTSSFTTTLRSGPGY